MNGGYPQGGLCLNKRGFLYGTIILIAGVSNRLRIIINELYLLLTLSV